MVPSHSELTSRLEVDLSSHDGSGTTIPLVVANMTAIAGRRMAETVARRGGLVVIPQDIPIPVVAEVVASVKARHTFFETPITLTLKETVADAASLIHKRSHGAIIIVDGTKPVGIVTEEDLAGVDRFTQLSQVMTQELTTMPDTLNPRQALISYMNVCALWLPWSQQMVTSLELLPRWAHSAQRYIHLQ